MFYLGTTAVGIVPEMVNFNVDCLTGVVCARLRNAFFLASLFLLETGVY